MSKTEKAKFKSVHWQKVLIWLLFVAVFLLLTRIGVRHYFKYAPVKPGTFPVTIGRVFAQWAVALLLLQSVLAARIGFLDKIFGLDGILKFHRISGIVCFFLASLHPLLMYVSGLKAAGPLSFELWPEALGGICIVGLWLAVVSSVWRKFVGLKYEQWLGLHKITASVLFFALAHMFVIESAMRKDWILVFWLFMLAIWAGMIAAARFAVPGKFAPKENFVVSSVDTVAENIIQIDLKPAEANRIFDFLPGQFAFVSFENPEIPEEEHPFTIASAPDNSQILQFLIKDVGDWTRKLKVLKIGDRAGISGPFGVFSPFRHENGRLIMIAGGIGITPMLSILRQLALENSELPVKLIWSYKTAAEAPCQEELENLHKHLSNFEIVRLITRERSEQNNVSARLDKESLQKLVPEFKEGNLVMLCGPAKMMKDVRQYLVESGYPASAVLSEEFAF